MSKKSIAALAVGLALGLSACGGAEGDTREFDSLISKK